MSYHFDKFTSLRRRARAIQEKAAPRADPKGTVDAPKIVHYAEPGVHVDMHGTPYTILREGVDGWTSS